MLWSELFSSRGEADARTEFPLRRKRDKMASTKVSCVRTSSAFFRYLGVPWKLVSSLLYSSDTFSNATSPIAAKKANKKAAMDALLDNDPYDYFLVD